MNPAISAAIAVAWLSLLMVANALFHVVENPTLAGSWTVVQAVAASMKR